MQERCHADLRTSINGVPKVQLACGEPIPNLSRRSWLGKAVGVERDGLNLGKALGAPGKNGLSSPNDNERFGLNGDRCRSYSHGSLHG